MLPNQPLCPHNHTSRIICSIQSLQPIHPFNPISLPTLYACQALEPRVHDLGCSCTLLMDPCTPGQATLPGPQVSAPTHFRHVNTSNQLLSTHSQFTSPSIFLIHRVSVPCDTTTQYLQTLSRIFSARQFVDRSNLAANCNDGSFQTSPNTQKLSNVHQRLPQVLW